ncbi:MAG: 4Fe-4S cluster-binding domain-containing protein [Spirochaetaceae bacterium]|nr:4Fe-4S cluster-binding domain-containing protein [Spirochaetaceae bacterium]
MAKYIPVLLKAYISPHILRDMHQYFIVKAKKITKLFPVEIHVVEHCNLNCKTCNHFSCLAREEYLDPENFEKDIKCLSEITKRLYQIKLLGGEPLLHPRLTCFFPIVRKYFPDTPLQLTTNGILLTKQPEQFWLDCRKNKVLISISQYPIKLDREEIRRLSRQYKVRVEFNGTTEANRFVKMPLDITGSQNSKKSFHKCAISWGCCVTLRDGRIYTCCIAGHIRFFNEYFNQSLAVREEDYVDIYKIKNIKEIIDFLEKPFPFCRYCKPQDIQFAQAWGISKKEINEWV